MLLKDLVERSFLFTPTRRFSNLDNCVQWTVREPSLLLNLDKVTDLRLYRGSTPLNRILHLLVPDKRCGFPYKAHPPANYGSTWALLQKLVLMWQFVTIPCCEWHLFAGLLGP
jgi:hypothetical protein